MKSIQQLASIPSLEVTATPAAILPSTIPTSLESAPATISNSPSLPPVVPEDVVDVHQTAVAAPPNPEILRFTKMLAFGVPLMAVEQKMRAEGYDPALLNDSKTVVTKVPPADHSSSDDALEESNSDED